MEHEAESLGALIGRAFAARAALLDDKRQSALRLLNGFSEGCPDLAVDLYGATAVIYNYADDPATGLPAVEAARAALAAQLPWLQTIILKTRAGAEEARRGLLIAGERPTRRVRENGVWYALDLLLNRDASLYLDTRNLRAWAQAHLADKRVLNTFAYTGSLGVAAAVGGARQVVQLDLSRRFLNLAKDSYSLNGLPIRRADFLVGDFWPLTSRMRRAGAQFDCVILDAPIFAETRAGTLELGDGGILRLTNKVRPLVADGGTLVVVNNALFHSGAAFMAELEQVCADGYLTLRERISVPDDCVGFPATRSDALPSDPAPFNHATKIAVLDVRRKAGAS